MPPLVLGQFYQEVNFIACFSSKEERVKAGMVLGKPEFACLGGSDGLASTVRHVCEVTTQIDPKINTLRGVALPFDREQEMLQVGSCAGTADSLSVTVRVISVEPTVNSEETGNFARSGAFLRLSWPCISVCCFPFSFPSRSAPRR